VPAPTPSLTVLTNPSGLSLHLVGNMPLPLSATFGPDGTRVALRFRY
jgi:hypothetical protein